MFGGTRIRSQIAGILFLLFSLAMLLVVYFNISILYEILTSEARTQLSTVADSVLGWVEREIPADGYHRQYLDLWTAQSPDLNSLLDRAGTTPSGRGVHAFQILDAADNVVWQYGATVGDPLVVRRDLASRQESRDLWQSDDGGPPEGRPLDGISVVHPPRVTYEAFRPIFKDGRLVGSLHLSLAVPELARRYLVVFWGNAILAFIFVVTAFIAIMVWSHHAIGRPLGFILHAQEKLSKGDFNARVDMEVPSANELMAISNSFNHMSTHISRIQAELLEKTRRLMVLNDQYRSLNEQLEAQVEEKTRELREFFSLITHDLKVPLAAIQGYTDLLLRSKTGELSDKQRKFLHSIGTSTTHLLNLVRNMTDSVKYDGAKITYYMEDFCLPEVLEEASSQVGPILSAKDLALVVEVPPRCQYVHGDRTKLGQVFINLIGNAANATPDFGTITVRAKDRGQTVEIVVSDTGAGIPSEHLKVLFDKFTQFPTMDGASSGLGLGLYIVRKILEGHQRTVSVTSTPGLGTTFSFSLAKAAAPPAAGEEPPAVAPAKPVAAEPEPGPMTTKSP